MKNFMILLLAITITACASSGGHYSYKLPKDVDASKMNALVELRKARMVVGDYEKAVEASNKLIELLPDQGHLYYLRGEAYAHSGNYENAIKDFEKALSMDPGDIGKQPVVFFNIGTAYLKWGKNDEAITYFDKALRLEKRYVSALVHRGGAYSNIGKYDLGKADFEAALKIDPQNALAYRVRADVYAIAEDYKKVVADLNKCLELDPKEYSQDPVVFHNRGEAYHKLGRLKEALEDFDRALRLNPRYVFALVNRGNTYAELRKYDLAFKDFDEAIEYEPTNINALFWRGTLYYSTEKLDPALKDLTKAVELNPLHIVAHLLITGVYSRQNNMDKACQWLKKTVEAAKKTSFENWSYLKTAKEFENIRKSPCYKEVMASK